LSRWPKNKRHIPFHFLCSKVNIGFHINLFSNGNTSINLNMYGNTQGTWHSQNNHPAKWSQWTLISRRSFSKGIIWCKALTENYFTISFFKTPGSLSSRDFVIGLRYTRNFMLVIYKLWSILCLGTLPSW
jgi:hypothetical protein